MTSIPIFTDNWANALEPNIIAIWDEEMDSFQDELAMIPILFDVQTTRFGTTTAYGVGSGGNVPERPEGGDLTYDTREQLYAKTFTQRSKDKGIAISEEMITRGEYAEISRMVRELATQFSRTRLTDAFSDFNNAFSATYAGPDGVALCSASHPTSPTNAAVKSNVGTSVLSYDAVVSTRAAMMTQTDSRGNQMNVMPDLLLVPVQLEATAQTIVNSMGRPGVGDNDLNFIGTTGMSVMVSRYLSDANNWFLIDKRGAGLYHIWVESDPPSFGYSQVASKYRVSTFAGHMAYDWGWSAWQWVYGHNVA